jgi:hypothetical protein
MTSTEVKTLAQTSGNPLTALRPLLLDVAVAVNAVSIAISFWSGDPRIVLAKEGAITSTIGIAILISASPAVR